VPDVALHRMAVDQELHAAASAKAASEGRTLAEVVAELLERYVKAAKPRSRPSSR
jgi:predicted HicB family RNase H-like nuclease